MSFILINHIPTITKCHHKPFLEQLTRRLHFIRFLIIKKSRWEGYAERMEYTSNALKELVRKHEGKRALGRFRRRWKDVIKMDITMQSIRMCDCIHLAQRKI
jgi:hypothetical protein